MIHENKPPVGLTYAGRPRTYGIRFSVLDGVVLGVAFAITWATWDVTSGFSMLLLFVVLHFFLFCNIFRVRRKPELIWAGIFIANCCFWVLLGNAELLRIMVCQLIVTVGILVHEIRLPCYHGVLARSVNPRLDDYLADRLSQKYSGSPLTPSGGAGEMLPK